MKRKCDKYAKTWKSGSGQILFHNTVHIDHYVNQLVQHHVGVCNIDILRENEAVL